MLELPILDNKTDIFDRIVFLRADLDVPFTKFKIQSPIQSGTKFKITIGDDARLLAWMPTLKYLLDNRAKVIVAGHLGRPEKKYQISNIKYQISNENKEFSLEPIARWFSIKYKVLSIKYGKRGEFDGWEIGENIFLLENLRFFEGEEKNDPEFAKKLADLADLYVNDAFAASHRNHASIVGVPKYLPHFAGFRLQEEVGTLSLVLQNPKRPLVVIIGGAKIETKLPLVETMCNLANHVLVGGKIARESDTFSKIMIKKPANKLKLLIADLNKDKTDITPKSLSEFLEIIKNAKTIVWNGPIGLINEKLKMKNEKLREDTERGTRKLASSIAESSAFTIVGGGDTIDFIRKINLINKFSFVSTGGGAMLAFLSKENMPGLKALISPK